MVIYVSASVVGLLTDLVELSDGADAAVTLMLLSVPLFILQVVFFCILHYRCWRALPEDRRATTPARAIGFMFIPLFNFYWAFVTWPKLSVGLLQWQRDVGVDRPDDTRNMAYAYAVLIIGAVTISWMSKWLGILISIADVVVFVLYYRQVVSGLNRMLSHGAAPVSGA
ncbi:MAG: hypothetical protein NTY19_23355 [Planctomycetota bacterium]|nr:hypothetical protein [Planctomycetota bacterium]